jgi:hypothetical protein
MVMMIHCFAALSLIPMALVVLATVVSVRRSAHLNYLKRKGQL